MTQTLKLMILALNSVHLSVIRVSVCHHKRKNENKKKEEDRHNHSTKREKWDLGESIKIEV